VFLPALAVLLALLPGSPAAPGEEAAAPPRETRALRRTPVVEVFESARDAVVNISSTEVVEVRDPFDQLFQGFFRSAPRTMRRTSIGSGFVIHPQGYIVTNAHVVARSTDRTVTFAGGREYDARVVAADREHDVAILKIEAGHPLRTLPFGRSADLMVGETVIAIGNPLGYQHTVTAGVVSAVDRDLESGGAVVMRGLVQTDASINPGNSGGPLLNVLGELVGVNTAIIGDAQNIGFAIPVDQLRSLLPDLLDVERRYRVASGLVLARGEPRVESVERNSPAERAGVEPGDIVRAVDGAPVGEGVDFWIALIGRGPGDVLELELLRGGRTVRAEMRLEGRPRPDAAALLRERIGVAVRPLPGGVARELRLPRGQGLVVIEVAPASPAGGIGIQPGDVLLAVGRQYPTTLEELGDIADALRSGQQVPVTWLRVVPPQIIRFQDVLTLR
jgi:serine protease Do